MFIDYAPLSDCVNEELGYGMCLQCNKCGRFNENAEEKKIICKECAMTNYYLKEPKTCIECGSSLVKEE